MEDNNLVHPDYGQVLREVELLSFSVGVNTEGNIESVFEYSSDASFFDDGFFAVIDTNTNEIADTIEIIHPDSEKHQRMPLVSEISGILIARYILKDKIEDEVLYVVCPFLDIAEISSGAE